ncbi:hypothetical protein IFM12275_16140 [Nocardia sputorum]|nr:hypothetical protein IFM12275_16140 [Nocardia sputorum]
MAYLCSGSSWAAMLSPRAFASDLAAAAFESWAQVVIGIFVSFPFRGVANRDCFDEGIGAVPDGGAASQAE